MKYIKTILYLCGGALITLIYRVNKKSIECKEKDKAELQATPLLMVSEVKSMHPLIQQTLQQVFVEGKVSKQSQLLKCQNHKTAGVFKEKKTYEHQIIQHNGKEETKKHQLHPRKKKFVDSFKLINSIGNNDNDYGIVQNFQNSKILPGSLKTYKKQKIYEQPIKETHIRPAKNDEEEQQQQSGSLAAFTTHIFKLGVTIEESILAEGSIVCVFGRIIYDQENGYFKMIAPKYIGKSKQEILDLLSSDIGLQKFFNFLLYFVGITLGYFVLKHIKAQIYGKKQQKQ